LGRGERPFGCQDMCHTLHQDKTSYSHQ
jgi:hypothetical protein